MPRAQYDAIEAINISKLIHGVKSMAHLKQHLEEYSHATSDALRFGQLVHLVVFEPHLVEERVISAPECNRRGKDNKVLWDAFDAECERCGKIGATVEELNAARAMRAAVMRDREARRMIEFHGHSELAVVWRDAETGLLCKGRIDRLCKYEGWPVILDLKTTDDARVDQFYRAVRRYQYHVHASWYSSALNTISPLDPMDRRFIWLAVEKNAPHALQLHEAPPEALAEGAAEWRKALTEYAEAKKTNNWPSYPSGVNVMKWHSQTKGQA
jgi:exodeoxyribonuclease VIII